MLFQKTEKNNKKNSNEGQRKDLSIGINPILNSASVMRYFSLKFGLRSFFGHFLEFP